MSMKTLALALAVSTVMVSAADAAVVTKSYEVVMAFNGPKASVRSTFDLTYDTNTSTTGGISIANFKSDGGDSFTQAEAYYTYSPASKYNPEIFPESRYITIGGAGNAQSVKSNADDFYLFFGVNNEGQVAGNAAGLYSTRAGSNYYAQSVVARNVLSITTPTDEVPVSPVPEPATWAMLLVGFGMIGAASRYRRRSIKVSLA